MLTQWKRSTASEILHKIYGEVSPITNAHTYTQLVIKTRQSGLLTLFLTPLMLCVLILYISGGTYCSKSTPNERNFSRQFYSLSRVFARNLLRGNHRRNTFRISFWCLAWDLNPGFSPNKSTHYLLDDGDLITNILIKFRPSQRKLSYQKGYFIFRSKG